MISYQESIIMEALSQRRSMLEAYDQIHQILWASHKANATQSNCSLISIPQNAFGMYGNSPCLSSSLTLSWSCLWLAADTGGPEKSSNPLPPGQS